LSQPPYRLAGTYYEACNCDVICPCRSIGGRIGGSSTHGICFGTLSWKIEDGYSGDVSLSGLCAVMCLRFYDRTQPSMPWDVVLFVDERGSDEQRDALERIFLGRDGGMVLSNFAAAIGDVLAVRPAQIRLDHAAGQQAIEVGGAVTVRAGRPAESSEAVACGIPGLDRPGQELWTDLLRMTGPGLDWELSGTCGFATDFEYLST
jgi:hypothetical protein